MATEKQSPGCGCGSHDETESEPEQAGLAGSPAEMFAGAMAMCRRMFEAASAEAAPDDKR